MTLTFDEARVAVTQETGQPTKPVGFEGPDRYLVTPDVDYRDIVFNDSVTTVGKETGVVATEHYEREEMAQWSRVESSLTAAAPKAKKTKTGNPAQARIPKGNGKRSGRWTPMVSGILQELVDKGYWVDPMTEQYGLPYKLEPDLFQQESQKWATAQQTLDEDQIEAMEGMAQEMSDVVQGNPIAVAVEGEVLEEILRDGRMVGYNEVHPEAGGPLAQKGMFYGANRESYERSAGVPEGEYPISGYILDDRYADEQLIRGAYGEYKIVLNDAAKRRSTVTYGDSMDYELEMMPIGKIDSATMDEHIRSGLNQPLMVGLGGNPSDSMWDELGKPYIEAQIHGGVSLGDIDFVIVPSESYSFTSDHEGIMQALDAAGIRWEMGD